MKVIFSQQLRPQQRLTSTASKVTALKTEQGQGHVILGTSDALPEMQESAPSQQISSTSVAATSSDLILSRPGL